MTHKILLIDDEPMVLSGYRRLLGRYYNMTTESDPLAAIELMKKNKDFSVVVSDYRMPKADGNRVLSLARELCPDTIRIMLTGEADLTVAIDAVNNGNIFRFLTKPCPNKTFKNVLDDAIRQHQLIMAERDLTEKTLQGSIKILIELLSTISPQTFTLVQRARSLAKKICVRLKIKRSWEYELAILLSKIGYITLPQEILTKLNDRLQLTDTEKKLFNSYAEVGKQLLVNIPRLENIAEAIALHRTITPEKNLEDTNRHMVSMAMLMRLVLDYTESEMFSSHERASEMIQKNSTLYNDTMRDALMSEIMSIEDNYIAREVSVANLVPGMILAAPIRDTKGTLIASAGTAVTEILKMKLNNFIRYGRPLKKIRVLDKMSG